MCLCEARGQHAADPQIKECVVKAGRIEIDLREVIGTPAYIQPWGKPCTWLREKTPVSACHTLTIVTHRCKQQL